jgi:transcriptional regulator with XRE-family HTH domain
MTKRSKIDPYVGPAIKRQRQAAGLSLDKVAASSGISKTHLWEIENLRTNPSFCIVRDIAMTVGFFLDDIKDIAEGN